MLLTAPLDVMPSIPMYEQHPGSFGFKRTHDIHTGVDLYTPYGSPVKAMEEGIVIKIDWFTGEKIGMPWWENTQAVYIQGRVGVFCYGEIKADSYLKVGDAVEQGNYFGHVINVLKKFKGRPMSMLHIELYEHGHTDTWDAWKIGEPQPKYLRDPTEYLLLLGQGTAIDPYKTSNLIYGHGGIS